ncbi:MAG: glycosyltransferase family 39 protein [Rhodospirillaceae bacterium]
MTSTTPVISTTSVTEHLRLWQLGALVALCLIMFLPGFFTLPPVDRDEARFAQASRQMVESGDYVSIRFQDVARLKKPIGIYWLQAASARLFATPGQAEIWPYRVPSLLGAIAAVLATAWAGSRLFGATTGFAAALMLAGCVVLGVEARLAKTDAVLLATIVVAQGALARIWLERRVAGAAGWGMPIVFWLAIGVGILVKGPIGPMVSGLTILVLGLHERRFDWLRRLRPWLGLAVVVAIVSPWLVAITIKTGGLFFSESVGHDLMGKVAAGQEGKGLPPGYFIGVFWLTFAPYALGAALAVPWVWTNRRDPAVLFCLAWLIPVWLVFEAVPTKLPHYNLPVFPALALLIARAARDHFGRTAALPRTGLFVSAAGLAGSVALALPVAVALVPWLADRRLVWAALPLAAVAAVTVIGAIVLVWQRREALALALAFGGYALLAFAVFQLVLPVLEAPWLSSRIAERVAELRPCTSTRLVSADYSEPSLVFLVGTNTHLGGGDHAADHLRNDPVCALSLVQGEAEPLFRRRLNGFAVRPLATFQGFNYSRGKFQSLTLYAAEHTP